MQYSYQNNSQEKRHYFVCISKPLKSGEVEVAVSYRSAVEASRACERIRAMAKRVFLGHVDVYFG